MSFFLGLELQDAFGYRRHSFHFFFAGITGEKAHLIKSNIPYCTHLGVKELLFDRTV